MNQTAEIWRPYCLVQSIRYRTRHDNIEVVNIGSVRDGIGALMNGKKEEQRSCVNCYRDDWQRKGVDRT